VSVLVLLYWQSKYFRTCSEYRSQRAVRVARLCLRRYLYFFTSKASTFVLVQNVYLFRVPIAAGSPRRPLVSAA
jgi:hypothetical protein